AGFEVTLCANGYEGIDAARSLDPTVVTLDVNMPGIDGFETAKRLRTFSSAYIVMLTALGEEIDTLQGLESGADDYVTKPFRPRELRARIEAMLRRPRVATSAGAGRAAGSGKGRDGRTTNRGATSASRGLADEAARARSGSAHVSRLPPAQVGYVKSSH